MAIDFQKMFEDELAKSSAGYDEQIKGYEASQAAEQKALDDLKAASIKKLEDSTYQAKRDAYSARRSAERELPQILAAQGITGGLTETTASGIYNDFLKAQNKANTTYTQSLADVENDYSKNVADLKTKWASLIGEAQQNKRNDAFAKAQWAYQAALAEEERRKQEEAQRAAAASRRGGGGGSGYTNPNTTNAGTKGYGGYINPYAEQENAKKLAKLSTNPYGQLEKDKYYARMRSKNGGGIAGGGFGGGGGSW